MPEANATGMFDKVKGELAAAVAVSGALFIAAGYGLVWAKVVNAGLPVQPILSALPTTFFISSAVEALAIPLVIMLPVVTAIVALRDRSKGFPGFWWWFLAGIVLAAVGRFATRFDHRLFSGWNDDATALSWKIGIIVVIVSAVLGWIAKIALGKSKGEGPRLQAMAGLMLVLSIGTVSAYRIVDARTVDQPLPYVGAFLHTEDCPPVFDVLRQPFVSSVTPEGDVTPPPKAENVKEARCYVAGFYLGESDKWMFVAKGPDAAHDAPGRLLLLPRDSAQIAATATAPLKAIPTPNAN